jgi:membrane associated rhomboid family serine protease
MFFILPVGVDYRARRYPVVTFTIMGICVAVYLLTLPVSLDWVRENLWLIPAESHWWTYVTSLFVHAGLLHLVGNMVYLFLFGSCVEDTLGRPRYISFYLLSGVVSEFSHIALTADHFGSEVALGGASGAISGCIGAFLLLFLRTKIEFKWVIFFFFRLWNGEFFLPAWLVISFWFLSDLAGAALTMAAGEHGEGVAFGAHVGGTICGLMLIALLKWCWPSALDLEEEDEAEAPVVHAPVATPASRGRIRVQLKSAPAVVEVAGLYLCIDETQSGPFTSGQIQQMQLDGTIPLGALFWREGMESWRSIEELQLTPATS